MAGTVREIKTTLALDGEKQYKSSLDEAYRAMRVLGSEMKATSAAFAGSGDSVDALRSKNEVLNKQIAQQKEIVESLRRAVNDSASAYGENDKKTDSYRIKLNNATAALSKMEGELKDNQGAIENFGKNTEDADKKTKNWHDTLSNLSNQLDSAFKFTGKVTAGLSALGGAVAGAGKKLFDITKSGGEFADNLITLSNQTRISTETLQKWEYASRFVDVSVDTMTGSMVKMIRNMDTARKGSGASAEAFQKLGVSITDSNGELLNSEEVFMTTIDALGRVANETERDALSMAIFGKSAQELNPLIQSGSAELQKLGDEAQKSGLIVEDAALNKMGAFDDAMQRATAAFDAIKNNIAAALAPTMERLVEVIKNVALQFNEWLQSDGAQALIGQLGEKLQNLASGIGDNLTPIIQSAIDAFQTVISTVGAFIDNLDTLKTVAAALAGGLIALKIAQIAVNAAMASNPIGMVVLAIGALGAAIAVLITHWGEVKRAVIDAWNAIVDSASAAIKNIIDFFGQLWENIKAFPSKMLTIGVDMVKGIWEGIKSMGQWFADKVTGWFDGAVGSIKGMLGIHSPSRLMADVIGKPMGQGVAVGILSAKGDVNAAMKSIVPNAGGVLNLRTKVSAYESVGASVARQAYNAHSSGASGGVQFSPEAINQLAGALKAAFAAQGDTVLTLNDREMARFVRGVSFA